MQRADEPAPQAGEVVFEAAVVDEYLPPPQQQLLALLRQPHEAVIADHQPDAEILFELLDRGRERRLRDAARLRRAREVLLARERNEVGQVAYQHGRVFYHMPRCAEQLRAAARRRHSAGRRRLAATAAKSSRVLMFANASGALEQDLARAEPLEHLPRRRMSAVGQRLANCRQRRDGPQRAQRLAAVARFGHRRAALGAARASARRDRPARAVHRTDSPRACARPAASAQINPTFTPASGPNASPASS